MAFHNGESQASASHCSMCVLGQTWVMGISLWSKSNGKMLSDIQRDSDPYFLGHENLTTENWSPCIFPESQFFQVYWKGTKHGQTTQYAWKLCSKKPRVRTLAKPYWKPVILVPVNQGSICLPSAAIIIFLEDEGKRLFCTFIPKCSGFPIR